jgi:hypothetical protein
MAAIVALSLFRNTPKPRADLKLFVTFCTKDSIVGARSIGCTSAVRPQTLSQHSRIPSRTYVHLLRSLKPYAAHRKLLPIKGCRFLYRAPSMELTVTLSQVTRSCRQAQLVRSMQRQQRFALLSGLSYAASA